MSVSVLLPTKNSDSEYLRLSIKSVLEQDFPHFELLVIDSGDASIVHFIDVFRDRRIQYFHKPELNSLAEQLNFGLEHCRFDLVARMDADDISSPNRLSTQLGHFEYKPDLALLGTQISVIDETGEHLGDWSYPCLNSDIRNAIKSGNPLAHPSVMFRKQAVLDVGGYCPFEGAEDYELWSEMIINGYFTENTKDILLKYRLHKRSIKFSKVKSAIRSNHAIKKKYWFESMNFSQKIRFYIEKMMMLMPSKLVYRLYVLLRFR